MAEPELAFLETEQSERKDLIERAAQSLLRVSFTRALTLSSELSEYIKKQSDAEGVEEEFRQAWEVDVSELLLSVLAEVLAKEDDQALLAIMLSAPSPQPLYAVESNEALPKPLYSSLPKAAGGADIEGRAERLRRFMNAPEFGTIEFGGWLPGEMAAPPSGTVDDLLRMSFGDALCVCEELRSHLLFAEDGQDLEDTFRQFWGPDAPESLRSALEQILNVADDDTESVELLEENMAWTDDDSEVAEQSLLGSDFLTLPVAAKVSKQPMSKL